jgi:hypothetical protein
MLDTLTATTFAPLVDEPFSVSVDGTPVFEARLSSVTPWGQDSAGPSGRVPFTLLFHAPAGACLPQQIFRLEHDQVGAIEIFLVPLGPDAKGMRYEAVFT